MANNAKILAEFILALSHNKMHVELAFAEWGLANIYDEPEGTCPCSHFPIREHCVIVNAITGREATVGNCCIKKFMDHLDTDGLFAGLRRISIEPHDLYNWPSKALLKFARQKGAINAMDYYWADFLRLKRTSIDVNTPYRKQRRRDMNVAIINFTHPGKGDLLLERLREKEEKDRKEQAKFIPFAPFVQFKK